MPILRISYFAVVILCVGISVYLTYFGFERTFRELTLAFTAIIGLLLFAADFLIQRNRENGYPILPGILLFFIAATFSSLSNFNYLYTNFMTRDVTVSTMREQYAVFREDLQTTRARLGETRAVTEGASLRSRVENELEQMWRQMTDPSRPGCGERCEDHIQTLTALLGTPVTDLVRPGPSATQQEMRVFFETFRGLVLAAMGTRADNQRYQDLTGLQRYIDERLRFFGTAEDAIDEGAGLERIAVLSEESREIERRANALLSAERAVTHRPIDPTLGRLGEIVFSLKNAFVEVPNRGATIMAAVLAVVVDIIPVIFALLVFRPGEMAPTTKRRSTDVFS